MLGHYGRIERKPSLTADFSPIRIPPPDVVAPDEESTRETKLIPPGSTLAIGYSRQCKLASTIDQEHLNTEGVGNSQLVARSRTVLKP